MKRIIYYIFLLLFSIGGIYLLFNATIVPDKILYLIVLFYVVSLILILILITRKRKFLQITAIILSIILLILNSGMVYIYHKTNAFFDKITNIEYREIRTVMHCWWECKMV